MAPKDRSTSFMSVGNSGLFSTPNWLRDRRQAQNGRSKSSQLTPLLADFTRLESEVGNASTPAYVFNSNRLPRQRTEETDSKFNSSLVAGNTMIGIINSAVLIPTMVGFTSIIYRDEFFSDPEHNYFPELLKLVFLSAAIHQVCFLAFSSLPFAVGQVQDAGLIFLSSMAVKIVDKMKGSPPDEVISTVVTALALSTALLGILLIFTGYMRLAGLVQYLPLPVIGGYLAFIGLFCGESGLRLMTGSSDIVGIEGLLEFFHWHNVKLSLPGIAAAAALFIVSAKVKNRMVLPMLLFSFPILFYVVLLCSGISVEVARNEGWINEKSEVPHFSAAFEHFDFGKVKWSAAFPTILPDFFAMYAVVAFGSCLDVAAIQFEMGKPLNFDKELIMVGISNFASGIAGGYTGSYLFSQSIFALRNGVETRIAGIVIVFIELCVFFLPIDLMGILPRFFFGCVLLFVAFDMLLDWLVVAYFKLELREYTIVWASFLAINLFGLEAGMAIGAVVAALNFVFSYAQLSNVELVHNPASNIVRAIPERNALDHQKQCIVVLRLSGFQFFGSTAGVLKAVKSNVFISVDMGTPGSVHSDSRVKLGSTWSKPSLTAFGADDSVLETSSLLDGGNHRDPRTRSSSVGANEGEFTSRIKTRRGERLKPRPLSSFTTPSQQKVLKRMSSTKDKLNDYSSVLMKETRFLVLDCSNVPSIDATAARGCFLTLLYLLQQHGIELIFAGLSHPSRALLESHGVLCSESLSESSGNKDPLHETDLEMKQDASLFALSYPCINEAIEYCENRICNAIVANPRRSTLSSVFPEHSDLIGEYFEEVVLGPGEQVFRTGDLADAFFVTEKGTVSIVGKGTDSNRYNRTSLFGHIDFFKQVPHTITATTGKGPQHILLCMKRNKFEEMVRDQPALAAVVQKTILELVL